MLKASASDYPLLYLLRRILAPDSVVFDFGGHVGVSYHAWRGYLEYGPALRWIVHDLPAVTRAGELIARERPSPGLGFTNDLGAARDATFFLAAGSLQFVDGPWPGSSTSRSGFYFIRSLIARWLPDGQRADIVAYTRLF
jgi:putative methyltransferase (TIGR04325 family)